MISEYWYRIGRFLVIFLANLTIKLDIQRSSNLPDGAFILAANHPSIIDPAMVTILTRKRVRILILETLFKIPLFGRSLRWSGHVPVVCGQGSDAINKAREIIDSQGCLAIFPEGVITPISTDDSKGHTGAARLALEKKIPIVPIGISLSPKNLKIIRTQVEGKTEVGVWYFHGPYAITVGEPLYFYGDSQNRDYVQYVTHQIMHKIYQLSAESDFRIKHSDQQLPWPLASLQVVWQFVRRSIQALGGAGMI